MIVGSPSSFAIESSITDAYERLSFRALGYFVIHVGGRCYGVRKPDATMLACSFDEVQDRIACRGKYTAPFAGEADAGEIAEAFRNAIYSERQEEKYFGIPLAEFCAFFHKTANSRMWAPDGDEAFDDGSYVLHFDVGDRVRLIAFKSDGGGGHDPSTLREEWLAAEDFYRVLQEWRDGFEAEWAATPKLESE
jgi:immunity protein 42 of polymorphic toxin system